MSTGLPLPNPQPRRWLWPWGAIALGVTGSTVVAGWMAWSALRAWLPGYGAQLTEGMIQRPVEVGPLQSLSLTEARFGRSRLPATARDPNSAVAEEVRVSFNLFNILTWTNLWGARALPFEVDVWRARVEAQQLPNGMPLELRLADGPPGMFQPRMIRLNLRESEVNLTPAAQLPNRPSLATLVPVQLRDLEATLDLEDWPQGQPLIFRGRARGRSLAGGSFEVSGRWGRQDGLAEGSLKGIGLELASFAQLLPAPIALTSGRVDGNLEVRYQLINGGLGRDLPTLKGEFSLAEVVGRSTLLATLGSEEFSWTGGKVRLGGQAIAFEQARLGLGRWQAGLDGSVDLAGTAIDPASPLDSPIAAQFDLTTRLAGLDLGQVRSFPAAADLPPLTGRVDVATRLTGSLAQPEVSVGLAGLGPVAAGPWAAKRLEAEVSLGDLGESNPPPLAGAGAGGTRVSLRELMAGSWPFAPRQLELKRLVAELPEGGQITSSGVAQLGAGGAGKTPLDWINRLQGQARFSALPVAALARRAGVSLPIDPGTVSGQVGWVGKPNDAQAEGQLQGETSKLGGLIAFRGGWQGERLSGSAQWQDLQLDRLLAEQLPTALRGQIGGANRGQATATARLVGTQLSELRAEATTQVTIAGGSSQVRAQVTGDRWQAIAGLSGLALGSFLPAEQRSALPGLEKATFAGQATAGGSLAAGLAGTVARLTGQLSDPSGPLGQVTGTARLVGNQGWQAQAEVAALAIDRLSGRLPGTRFNGTFAGNGALTGSAIAANWQGRLADSLGPLASLVGSGNLTGDRWQAATQIEQAKLDRLSAGLAPDLAIMVSERLPQGIFNGQVTALGNLSDGQQTRASLAGRVSDRAGTAAQFTGNAQLAAGDRWQATAQLAQVQLNRLAPQITRGSFAGRLGANGTIAALTAGDLGAIAANLSGSVSQVATTGGSAAPVSAQVTANLAQTRWDLQATTGGLDLRPFAPQLPGGRFVGTVAARGRLPGSEQPAARGDTLAQILHNSNALLPVGEDMASSGGSTGSFDINEILRTATGSIAGQILDLGGGSLRLNGQMSAGRWQGTALAQGIALAAFSSQGLGRVGAQIQANGPVVLEPKPLLAGTRATIAGRLNPGPVGYALPALTAGAVNPRLPVTFQAAWTGREIALHRLSGPGLAAHGTIAAALNAANQPQVGPVDLRLALRDFDLAPLAQLFPGAIPDAIRQRGPLVAGRLTFDGQVTGPLAALQTKGTAELRDLVAVGERFASPLRGPVTGSLAQGVAIDLRGGQDRLYASLDGRFRPANFEVVRGESVVRGRPVRDGTLAVEASGWDLAKLELPSDLTGGFGAPRGVLAATARVDLDRLSAAGTLTIDRPWLGSPLGEQATAGFRYANGTVAIANGQLRQGPALYRLDGKADLFAVDPTFQGRLTVTGGRLEGVAKLLRLSDFASAAEWAQTLRPPGSATAALVQPAGILTAGMPVSQQLKKLAEVQALLRQQVAQRCASATLPPFDRLMGNFGGTIDLTGSLARGATARFDIQGADWDWTPESGCSRDQVPIAAERVELRGSFAEGTVQVDRFELASGPTRVKFAGQLGQTQSGTLLVNNFPAERFRQVPAIQTLYSQANLPRLAGTLNLQVALAGSIADPRARGTIELLDGRLNETPVRRATGNFAYDAARLNFSSDVAVRGATDAKPITLSGSLPQPLPWAQVQPTDNQIRFNAQVEDREIGLLGLLVPEFSWLGGKGSAVLDISGTTDEPRATGSVILSEAAIGLRGLPEPIRNLTGQANLTGDRLEVPEILGNFAQGQIRLAGMLPLARRTEADEALAPLTLNLQKLALNLPALYQGGVRGQTIIRGTVLAPILSGNLELLRGRAFLPSDPGALAAAGSGSSAPGGFGINPRFDQLNITLGEGLQVLQLPVLNFLAEGNLTLGGSLNDPQPEGKIRLRRGLVNLFTTQFTLERGESQFVEFRPGSGPGKGLDPNLDVNLVTSVPELSRSRLQTDNTTTSNPGEVRESVISDLGSARTVRVRARIQAPASQLLDSIRLSSRPSRSEAQILALIGGSLANTLDDRASGTVAIANLAGAGLLNTLQTNLAGALGLSDFRVYPTTVTAKSKRGEREDPETAVGLGIEAGIDLNDKLSTSATQVISEIGNSTRFNLDYRASDEVIVRGSIDPFSGDSRFSVQYEARF